MKEIKISVSDEALEELVDLQIGLGLLDKDKREDKLKELKEERQSKPLKALFGWFGCRIIPNLG